MSNETWKSAREAANELIGRCAKVQEMDPEAREEWEGGDNPDELPHPQDVLGVDVRMTATVLLTMNGPTIGVDYKFNSAGDFLRATYWTTDNAESRTEQVDLSDEEAETIADAYFYGGGGVDVLSESALSCFKGES